MLDFARRLAARRRPVWLRFVLVPGLTDDADDVGHIAEFAAGLGNVERVDVLPFHQMGRFKWETLGLDYQLDAHRAAVQRTGAAHRRHLHRRGPARTDLRGRFRVARLHARPKSNSGTHRTSRIVRTVTNHPCKHPLETP